MAGPQQLASIKVEVDDRGRTVHTFRQSSLGELDICLERGRLTMTGEMPKVETDAANLGTGVHSAIEESLRDIASGQVAGRDIAKKMAVDEFLEMSQHPDFMWVKYTEASATRFIEAAVDLFFDQVLERLDPVAVELGFGPIVIFEDDVRVIQITGSIDLFDGNLGAADWKTSGRVDAYKSGFGGKAWEKERWAIQPTVYTYALHHLGYLEGDGPWPFTYFAFAKDGRNYELQELTVYRHQGDFAWLIDKCLSHAQLVEAQLTTWPKNDNHALCSPTWCPAWSVCKGRFYTEDWPKKPTQPSDFVLGNDTGWWADQVMPKDAPTPSLNELMQPLRDKGILNDDGTANLVALRESGAGDLAAAVEEYTEAFGVPLLDEGWNFVDPPAESEGGVS